MTGVSEEPESKPGEAQSGQTQSGHAQSGMRGHLVRNSAFLAVRQGLSIALKLIGVFIISRILGPEKYGAYIAAYSVFNLVLGVGLSGIAIYLVRLEGELTDKHAGTATSMLLGQALLFVLIVELTAPLFSDYTNIPGFLETVRVMILALPVQILASPPMARIERNLDLKSVAVIELGGQALYYAAALPMALSGLGALSLAYALLIQSAFSCVLTYRLSRTLPMFGWDMRIFREIFGYMTSFSFVNFMWQLRSMINPFIVGPVLGAAAVGLIGMAVSILELLTVIRTMIWRIMMAAMAKFQSDTEKLRRVITEGMEIHLLAIGAVLLGFGWVGEWIVPVVFGARWLPLFEIYPYVALAYLNMATFNMHMAALSVMNRNWRLSVFQGANVAILGIVAYLCVGPFGMIGYGIAEVAACLSYIILHLIVARLVGSPDYRLTLIWWCGAVVGLFWRNLGVWAIAVPFAVLLLPPSIKRIKALADLVVASRKKPSVKAVEA